MKWQERDSYTRHRRKKMKTKLLFLDLDGTLLNDDKESKKEKSRSIGTYWRTFNGFF